MDKDINAIIINFKEYLFRTSEDFNTFCDVQDMGLTEVIKSYDPCMRDPYMVKTVQEKVKDLPHRRVFEFNLNAETIEDINALITRFVVMIKLIIDEKYHI